MNVNCMHYILQNIRVMAKYYTRVRITRMAELLDLTSDVSTVLLRDIKYLAAVTLRLILTLEKSVISALQ